MQTECIEKLSLLIPRLGSDSEGEIVATVLAIGRTLAASGLDFHDLTERLTRSTNPRPAHFPGPNPETFEDMTAEQYLYAVDLLLEHGSWINEKEHDFLENMQAWTVKGFRPSEKQRLWIATILERVA